MADIRDDEYISSLSGSQMDAALLDMAERTSEAWAVGERNGFAVSDIDPTYHNNAKYYAEQAARVVPTSGVPAVRYDTPQVLTEAEKQTVRNNIDAPNPTELLDLKMLGWTVPKDFAVQNYEENGVFHQRVGRVDLGSLVWNYASTAMYFYAIISDIVKTRHSNGICAKYTYSEQVTTTDKTFDLNQIDTAGNYGIYIKDTAYTDKNTFKSAMSDVYLYYELDTEITRPIDGGEWAVRYSNPNLLDNWWWGNGVINQRGQTTYTGGGYTIDRWKSNSTGSTLIVSDGYVILRNAYICQPFEKLLPHKTYTFSVLYSSGKISSVTKKVVSDTSSMTFVYDDTIHCTYFPNLKQFDIATTHNPNDVYVVAIKLEEGSVSTLLNGLSRFNRALELLKCQNHCVVLKGNSRIVAIGFVNGAFMRSFPLLYNDLKPTAAEMEGSFSVYSTGLPVINVTAVSVNSSIGTLDLTLAQNAPSNYSLGGLRPADDNAMIILHDAIGG